jgi:anti-sigma regulatory factor (Ser/Thr protein kinase)
MASKMPLSGEGVMMPVWSQRFPRSLEAAGEARGFLRDMLSNRIPPVALEDALLLTSELAMNGVRHVPAAEGDRLEVSVDHGDDSLKVSVRGPGKDFATSKNLYRRGEVGGWGLHLVGVLSSRWGVTPDSHGTAVWFEMDLGGV